MMAMPKTTDSVKLRRPLPSIMDSIVKPIFKLLGSLFVCMLLLGCGQQGPLYLPDEASPEVLKKHEKETYTVGGSNKPAESEAQP